MSDVQKIQYEGMGLSGEYRQKVYNDESMLCNELW